MNHHCPFAKRAMKPKGPATPVSSVTSTPSRVDRSRWVRGAIKIAIPKSSPGSVRYPGELLALEEQCLLDTPMPLQTYTSVGLYSGCILSEKVAVIRCPGWSSESSHFFRPLGAFPPQWRGCAPAPSAASSGAERRSIDQSTRLRPTHSPPFVPSLLAGRLPASASSSASGRLGLVQVGPGPVIETPTRERHQRIPSRPVRSRRADPVREAVSARIAVPSGERPPDSGLLQYPKREVQTLPGPKR
jgi:hypothetical protein